MKRVGRIQNIVTPLFDITLTNYVFDITLTNYVLGGQLPYGSFLTEPLHI